MKLLKKVLTLKAKRRMNKVLRVVGLIPATKRRVRKAKSVAATPAQS